MNVTVGSPLCPQNTKSLHVISDLPEPRAVPQASSFPVLFSAGLKKAFFEVPLSM